MQSPWTEGKDTRLHIQTGQLCPSLLENARGFVEEARQKTIELRIPGKGGRTALTVSQQKAIQAAVANSSLPATPEVMTGLLKRFEGRLCHRLKIYIPDDLRPAILSVLVAELKLNEQWLKIRPEKLVPLTAYSGPVGPVMFTKFPDFAHTPHLVRYAGLSYPVDPLGFLQQVREDMAAMALEDEFREWRTVPGIFLHAAKNNPVDPRRFLRKAQRIMAALASDEEFIEFRKRPHEFRYAAINYLTDPYGYLRRVQKTTTALSVDEEFKDLRDGPWLFRHAAGHYPNDPRGFLRKVQRITSELSKEEEFKKLPYGLLRVAAAVKPSDPRSYCRRELQKIQSRSVNKSEAAALSDTSIEGLLKDDIGGLDDDKAA